MLLALSFSNEVFPGSIYKFRVRAHNLNGWVAFEHFTIIELTGIPDKPLPVTIVMNNVFVRIAWTDTDYNFEAIDSYVIRIS